MAGGDPTRWPKHDHMCTLLDSTAQTIACLSVKLISGMLFINPLNPVDPIPLSYDEQLYLTYHCDHVLETFILNTKQASDLKTAKIIVSAT